MKYWFDTEFIEDGETIDLLSIGIVCEDGRELYLCNRDANLNKTTEWMIWNVYPHLGVAYNGELWYWNENVKKDSTLRWNPESVVVSHSEIRDRVKKFMPIYPKPEIWAYYADYDWVAFCQLFGRMVDLPDGFPGWCHDLKQLQEWIGVDIKLPEKKGRQHHSLDDAKWTREAYLWLKSYAKI